MNSVEGMKRLEDIVDDPVMSPIRGLRDSPTLCLVEAINFAIANDQEMAQHDFNGGLHLAHMFAQGKDNDPYLNKEEIAAIHFYTQESPFYSLLNLRLRTTERARLKPFFPFLKLILGAIYKLPRFKGMVYRGIKQDVSHKFQKDQQKVWWGFSSASKNVEVMNSEGFFGHTGSRTLFAVNSIFGVSIKYYSAYNGEDEVLLPPGTALKVDGILMINGVPFISLSELEITGMLDLPRPQKLEKNGGNNLVENGGHIIGVENVGKSVIENVPKTLGENLQNNGSGKAEQNEEFLALKVPRKFFERWLPNVKEFQPLYSSRVNGTSNQRFHQLCDDQGPTLTIVFLETGHIFGGYCGGSWSSKYKWKPIEAPGSFIFSITDGKGREPRIFFPKKGKSDAAVYYNGNCGPIFGNDDLRINLGDLSWSYSNLGLKEGTYEDPNSTKLEPNFLAGQNQNWKIKEVLVFKVV